MSEDLNPSPVSGIAASARFPVVGIGGAAGGLSALLGVLEHLPADCALAIVVVLNMAAKDDDSAVALLARSTAMPLVPVTGETRIEPGRVYLVPPRQDPQFHQGMLRLAPPDPGAMRGVSVDRFFRSLADAFQARAIAVVLSGEGSDGALGLARVREQGGVTLAQSPLDADDGAMPRAAIAGGSVDFVLSSSDIAARLLQLARSAGRIRQPADPASEGAAAADEAALADIMDTLRVRTRHDFRHYKRATLLRRIGRRLHVKGLDDLAAYGQYLRQHADETAPLLQDLLISVTSFFRDPSAMQSLARNALSAILKGRRSDDPVRVWVVGCATGEEAWSIAMMLHEQLPGLTEPPSVQIFATDIDDRAIAIARNGLYPGAIAQDMSPERLKAFFTLEDGSYRISESLRDSVLFASHNILHDAPFSRLDLVVCRHLMIYLDREVQAQIIERFRNALKPGGHLFLGMAESADAVPDAFAPVDERHRLYVVADPAFARERGAEPARSASPRPALPAAAAEVEPAQAAVATREERAVNLHARVLLDAFPASVLVDGALDILHMTAGAGRFMRHSGGPPTAALMANVHPELRLELRGALMAAAGSGKPVKLRGIPVAWEQAGPQAGGAVDVLVLPGRNPEGGDACSVIVFEEAPRARDEADAGADPALADENRRLRAQLAGTIERFDASTEELSASNAELARINDALRQTTEELAARREELQSANEELIAVNQEMKAKVDETGRIQDDLVNLCAAGSVVALFLDRAMMVKRFTPAAAERFGLSANAAPQSLADIAAQLDDPRLMEDATDSFQALRPIERLVHAQDGRCYLARIQPYRTLRDNIEGAVVHFADATPLRDLQDRLDDALEVLELSAQASERFAVIALDERGRIQDWQADATRMFGHGDGSAVSRKPFDVLAAPDDRQRGVQQATLREARERGRARADGLFKREDGRTFQGRFVIAARRGDPHRGFIATIHDRSELQQVKDAQEELATREQTLALERDASRRTQDESLEALASVLKRPLNLIQVNAEMLMRLPETRNIPVVGKMADSIGKAVAAQSAVIDRMQDLSLARNGRLPLQMQTISLREPIEAVVNELKEKAQARSLALDFDGPSEPLVATCDPGRIVQITRILVANAIRFTEQGAVAVRLAREGSCARLTVADTGIGIHRDSLEALFNAFDRPSPGPGGGRAPRGLGVGLALVRELAGLHEGRVLAESAGPGHGATFSLWLPLAAPVETAMQPPAAGDVNPLAGLRIVLVDDSIDLLGSFGALLGLEGAIVDTYDNAQAALNHVLERDTDLLISDLGMPDMDGYQLIAEVRRHPRLGGLPAIALTGYGRTRDPGHAVRAGFNAHTTKPATVEEVKNIVSLLKSL